MQKSNQQISSPLSKSSFSNLPAKNWTTIRPPIDDADLALAHHSGEMSFVGTFDDHDDGALRIAHATQAISPIAPHSQKHHQPQHQPQHQLQHQSLHTHISLFQSQQHQSHHPNSPKLISNIHPHSLPPPPQTIHPKQSSSHTNTTTSSSSHTHTITTVPTSHSIIPSSSVPTNNIISTPHSPKISSSSTIGSFKTTAPITTSSQPVPVVATPAQIATINYPTKLDSKITAAPGLIPGYARL